MKHCGFMIGSLPSKIEPYYIEIAGGFIHAKLKTNTENIIKLFEAVNNNEDVEITDINESSQLYTRFKYLEEEDKYHVSMLPAVYLKEIELQIKAKKLRTIASSKLDGEFIHVILGEEL